MDRPWIHDSIEPIRVHWQRFKGSEFEAEKTIVAAPRIVWIQDGAGGASLEAVKQHLEDAGYIHDIAEILFYGIISDIGNDSVILELVEINSNSDFSTIMGIIKKSICKDRKFIERYGMCDIVYQGDIKCRVCDLIN